MSALSIPIADPASYVLVAATDNVITSAFLIDVNSISGVIYSFFILLIPPFYTAAAVVPQVKAVELFTSDDVAPFTLIT